VCVAFGDIQRGRVQSRLVWWGWLDTYGAGGPSVMTVGDFNIRRYLARGVSGSLGLKSASVALGLLSNVILARGMGTDGFGVYSFIMAIIGLLGIPTLLGFPGFLVREVARYRVNREWALLRGLLARSHQVVFLAGLIMSFGAAVVILRLNGEHQAAFLLALPVLMVNALTAVGAAGLRAFRRVVLGQLPQLLIRPTFFVIVVGGLWWSGFALDVTIVVGVQLVATAMGSLATLVFLAGTLSPDIKAAPRRYHTDAWVKGAVPFFFLGGVGFVANQIDIIMLGALRESADVGIYKVAVQGAQLVVFVLMSVNLTLGPLISELFQAGDMERLRRVAIMGARVALLGSAPAALIFLLWGKPLVEFVFGAEYGGGSWPLAVLCVGQVISAAAGSVALVLNMTGHERDTLIGMSVSAILNIMLNALLIPRFGIEGAAWATTISLIIWNMLLGSLVAKRLGFWVSAGSRLKAQEKR